MEQEENNALTPQVNEELNATAEFQGNKDDEEDVLLTAQRYLNIFHQIHIFKEFRKKQFDEELLQVPNEIRKIIALLPGGRILLEHIAEITQERDISDPALDALLKSLEGKNHFSDNSISISSPEPTPMLAPVAGQPVLTAPIELGGDFTKALTDSFNTYSENLHALTVNIQKMAIAQQSAPTAIGGAVEFNGEFAKSLTDSFDAYTQNIRELTESIQKMVTMQQSAPTVAGGTVEIGGEFTKALTDSFAEYTQNIRELTESIQKIAITQQAAPAAISAPIEIGGEFTKSLTDSFDAYTQNIRELTESIQKMAITQQAAPAALAAPVELSGDFTKALTDSFDAYSQNIRELTENIQKIAANSSAIPNAQSAENILPEFKDSISEILRENANQQMSVLKTFGETLSKTIMESQKELITSLKNSPQNSMLVGKIMQFPIGMTNNEQEAVIINEDAVQNNTSQTDNSTQTAPEPAKITHQEPAVVPADLNSTQPTNATAANKVELKQPSIRITTPKTSAAEKNKKITPENTSAEKNKKAAPEKTETTKATDSSAKSNLLKSMGEKLSATKNKIKESLNTPDKKEKAENKEDKKQPAATTPHKEKAPKNADNSDIGAAFADIVTSASTPATDVQPAESTDVDINDVFAQLSGALSEDFAGGLTDNATASMDKKAAKKASYIDDFENDVPQPATAETDFSAAFGADDSAQKSTGGYNDEMSQIRDALNSSEPVSLDDFDVKPVSLNPDDDTDISKSFKDFAGEDFNNSFADAFADGNNSQDNNQKTDDDGWEYVDEDGNPVSDNADGDWEYEYVDEDGNPISADDNTEYEYVDENGNPVSADDDAEYEYVDEDGNPVSADDDTEWEYVDEDGNPIKPDGDDEWEYEYVDDENPTD